MYLVLGDNMQRVEVPSTAISSTDEPSFEMIMRHFTNRNSHPSEVQHRWSCPCGLCGRTRGIVPSHDQLARAKQLDSANVMPYSDPHAFPFSPPVI